jgi:hypothetical protein
MWAMPGESPAQLSRRIVLAGVASAAALPVAAAVSPIAPAAASQAIDPIFGAIDAFHRADAAFYAVEGEGDILDEVGDRWSEAVDVVMRTRPTTPAGLAAFTGWARERADWLRKNWTEGGGDFCTVSATIDDAVKALVGRLA